MIWLFGFVCGVIGGIVGLVLFMVGRAVTRITGGKTNEPSSIDWQIDERH